MGTAIKSPPSVVKAIAAATGEALGEVPCATPEEVRSVVDRARRAQRSWGQTTLDARCKILRSVQDLMVERRDELAEAISRETGKPRFEALVSEVFPTLELLDFCLRNAGDVLGDERVSHRLLKTVRSTLVYEPFGVVGLITPWNYPFFVSAGIGLTALVAGNAVVNKPSEFTPLVAVELERLLRDSELPEGLFQCVQGYGDVGAALIDAGPDRVSFTGSVATGRKVAEACGRSLIPVTLELGGKDAAIVLEDADLSRAVRSLSWAAFTNSGQVCASVERIYVHEQVAEEFTSRLVHQVETLRQGVDDGHVDVGSMNNRMQFEIVKQQVDEAREQGAKILTGGKGRAGSGEKGGYFFEPTVVINTTPEMKIQREETFGPVVTLVTVADADEAVLLANDSDYGLTASVWTRNEARGQRLARSLESGSVFINDHLVPSGAGEAPWGGVKQSGFGKTRGALGLRGMSRVKHVTSDCVGLRDMPVWYPYSDRKYQTISDLIPAIFGRGAIKRVRAGLKGLTGLFGLARP